MIYLLLSILSSVVLFAVFRGMGRAGIDNFRAVVVNYWIAGALGFALFHDEVIAFASEPGRVWTAVIMGVLFIGIFYLMVKTTQEYGISTGSVANKMSVVIPAVVAVFIYEGESVTWNKAAGILFALAGLYLTNKKPGITGKKLLGLLPLGVFLGSGLIDSLLNFAAYRLIETYEGSFSSFIFLCAGVVGTAGALIRRRTLTLRTFNAGVILGVVNFCTIYFVLKALNSKVLDASTFFPVNNVSIVLGSVLVSVLFFKERLSKLNIVGVTCAAVAILLLSLS